MIENGLDSTASFEVHAASFDALGANLQEEDERAHAHHAELTQRGVGVLIH